MKKIAVLKGGLSAEREVSLSSGAAVAGALRESGRFEVVEIDVSHDIAQQLDFIRPDVVFNALHGTYGEDGCVQGVLEMLQIPYTHSGVMGAAIAMHKPTAKILFESIGIKCAKGGVFKRQDILKNDVIERPYVIKPLAEGSSVGVYIIFDGKKIPELPGHNEFLVESFIAGRELTVGVIDNQVTEVCEISLKDGFYDYANKYTSSMTQYIIPAILDSDIYILAQDYALKAHKILGCRGVSRSDFRLSEDGQIYMLELNTNPGMTSASLIPKLAQKLGISFTDLVILLIESAELDNG